VRPRTALVDRWRDPLQLHLVPALLLLWQAAPVLLQEAADSGLLEAALRCLDIDNGSGEPGELSPT
jgi:hypothetical protein